MKIHDHRYLSLKQYERAGFPALKKPRRCPGCRLKNCLWKNGNYEREVREMELVCRITVPRFKCKNCHFVFSLFLGFLMRYRRFTTRVVAECIDKYLRAETTYRNLAREVSPERYELARPSFGRVFEWIDDFTKHAQETLGLKVNRACVLNGLEAWLRADTESPNCWKAHTEEKRQRLNRAATVLVEAKTLVKSTHLLRRLRKYFLKNFKTPFDIFSGHSLRLSLSQNSEHADQ